MKKALLCLLAAALPLLSQAVRVDPQSVMKTAGNVGPGAYPQLLAVPGPQVSVCTAPANGVPCTNHAVTYSDATAGTACPSNAQITIAASNTCVAFGDRQGNFGFWLLPGSYAYTVTFAGQNFGPYPITVPDANSATTPTNVKKFGCVGNGFHNDQPCFVLAFASGDDLYVPDGNYLIDISSLTPIAPFTPYWGIGGYHGTITFSSQAKWVVIPPSPRIQLGNIIFDGWNGATVNGLHITLQTPQTSTCLMPITGIYCGEMLLVKDMGTAVEKGITFNDLYIDNAPAIALISNGSRHSTFNNTILDKSAGSVFSGSADVTLNGFSCPSVSWDDCLDIDSSSTGEGQAGQVGVTLTGFHSENSYGAGLRIGTAEVNVSGFQILGSQNYGITIYDWAAVPDPVSRVSIANGTIRGVRNQGNGTDPASPYCGVYIYNQVPGASFGNISITNTHIVNTDGAGICSQGALGAIIPGTLSVTNSHIVNAGIAVNPLLEGSCFHIVSMGGFVASGNNTNVCRGSAYYVDGVGVGYASISGGKIFNPNGSQGAGVTVWMHNVRSYDVGGLNIFDDRNPALSYFLRADSTAGPGLWHDINFVILNPPVAGLSLWGGATDMFSNITPSTKLSSIVLGGTPANGSQGYCSDCDTPASQGATCTAAVDHTGAHFSINRGVIKCY